MQPLLLACLFALLASTEAQGQVDPSRIVKDVNKDCPVNTTLYTQDEFSVDKLFGQMTPMVTEGSRDSPCARAVPNLTDCATDGSLQVKEGCCSAACAGKMQQVMCNSTEIRQSISGVLFGAAKRCLGLQPSCELLSQPGGLLNSTASTNSSGNTTTNSPQPQQQQAGNSTGTSAANSTSVGSSDSSGSGSSSGGSASAGSSYGMNELAAALAAQVSAPYAPPDPFMPLVPRPVETAASAVVLATPEEIDAAAARNGSRNRAIVTSNTTRPVNSSVPAGAANSTEPRAPPGAQGLAPPAAAATAVDQDRAAPAGPPATSGSSGLPVGRWGAGAFAVVAMLLTAGLK